MKKVTTAPTAKPDLRCDEILLQPILRSYDAKGRVIDEPIIQPYKLYRGKTPCVWADIDERIANSLKQATQEATKKTGAAGRRP